jgi:Fungal specific transcription factor domain
VFSPNIPRSDHNPFSRNSLSTPMQTLYSSSTTRIGEPITPPTPVPGPPFERRTFSYNSYDQEEYLEMLTHFQGIKPVPMHIPSINDNALGISALPSELPDFDLCYALCELYFKHVNSWFPILHRITTLELLFDKWPLPEEEGILLHAIIVTALRFSSDSRLSDDIRKHYHKTSTEKVQLYGLRHSSITALQALIIVTLDLIGQSNGPPGWNMLAVLSRSAVHIGLVVESTSITIAPVYPSIYTLRAIFLPEPRDFIEDETRRRLLWAIYLLDRYATIG